MPARPPFASGGVAIELVVFDFDGVLVDSSAGHRRAWDELWRSLGIDGPRYEAIAGRRTLDLVRELTAALSPSPGQVAEWVERKQARARELLATAEIAFPDTVATVRALASDGYRLAVGSGASRRAVEETLARLALDGLFAAVVVAEDVAAGKPAPDVFQRAIDLAASAPERTLVVEDGEAGLRAGLAAGARAASVRTAATVEHPRFLGAFADLTALRAALLPGPGAGR